MLFKNFTSLFTARRYKYVGRVHGHEIIHSLAISNNGKILASGGASTVLLWDAKTLAPLVPPHQAHQFRGPVCRMVWAQNREDKEDVLCFGTGLGYLVFWRQGPRVEHFEEFSANRIGTGQEITDLAWDTSDDEKIRLAVGTRVGIVQVWTFDFRKGLQNIFSICLEPTVPKTVGFVGKDIHVFGAYDGLWHSLRGKDGVVSWTRNLRTVIGWTALCPDHNQFAIDNGTDGFDLYQMDDAAYVRTFQTRISGSHKPKQVLFAEGAQVIVGSSDHGVVYIFDHRTGEVLDTLDHAKKGVIQAIAAHDEARNTIVCASSGNDITVWTYEAEWPARGTGEKRTMGGVGYAFVQMLMVVATIVFMYQNLFRGVWPANSTFSSWMGIHTNWGGAEGNGYVAPAPRTTIIKEARLRVQESHHTDDETVQKVVDRVMKALAEMPGIKTRAKQRGARINTNMRLEGKT
ncbi:WD40-repeat-containing domain protein [Infundibulicybe gibba]|nr:WD40-repeat-containing domain protein [Infundibulicybe gibba]